MLSPGKAKHALPSKLVPYFIRIGLSLTDKDNVWFQIAEYLFEGGIGKLVSSKFV
jgi:hypothetical protein